MSRRFYGLSTWGFLSESVNGLVLYDDDWYRVWQELKEYAMGSFAEFLNETLADAIDHERPDLGRIHVNTYLPDNLSFPSWAMTRVNDNPTEWAALSTLTIRIRTVNYRYGSGEDFAIQVPVPYTEIFNYRNDLYRWLMEIARLAISHIRSNRQQPYEAFSSRLFGAERARWSRDALEEFLSGIDLSDKENEKAKALLFSHCTAEQIAQYESAKSFIVIGGETGATYRINRKSQINVDVMDGDTVAYRLCTVNDPDYEVPIEDQLLAQKTMIELNEAEFLYIAKRWSA